MPLVLLGVSFIGLAFFFSNLQRDEANVCQLLIMSLFFRTGTFGTSKSLGLALIVSSDDLRIGSGRKVGFGTASLRMRA